MAQDIPASCNLLVAFSDLAGFARLHEQMDDSALFKAMDAYFEFVGDTVACAEGRVVKCIGDAALIVFPEERVDDGIRALKTLKEKGDRWLLERQLPCRHTIKAHFGPVAAGPLGPKGDKRFDILGETVNTAARIPSQGFAMSAQVFRKLKPETRKGFKKHTPPVTYIPLEQRHQN
jgi:class 3 adenylate cyclase